jgi:hypothetical protein
LPSKSRRPSGPTAADAFYFSAGAGVQALMKEVLAKQLGRREEGVKEGTGIGKKITASLELVL